MKIGTEIWHEDAARHGWVMPAVSWWKRLPLIRHARFAVLQRRAFKYRALTSAMGLGIGGIPQYDRWVLFGIFHGYERKLQAGDRQE